MVKYTLKSADGLERESENVMKKFLSILLVLFMLMNMFTLFSCVGGSQTTTTNQEKPKVKNRLFSLKYYKLRAN